MYELIILWLLMQMPVHGFLIVKIINDMIGPVARASNSNIYPLLNRLAAGGHIEIFEEKTSENGLPMRIFRLTERGRERFHDLLLDVISNPRDYRELFAIKVLAFTFLNPEERLHLIDRYIDFSRKHIQHFAAEAADYRDRAASTRAPASIVADVLDAMQHYQTRWELELAWALALRRRETGPAPGEAGPALAGLEEAVRACPGLSDADREACLAAVGCLREQAGRPAPARLVVEGTLGVLHKALSACPEALEHLGAAQDALAAESPPEVFRREEQ